MASWQGMSNKDRLTQSADPRERAAGGMQTGTPRCAGSSSAARELLPGARPAEPRLLHQRPAVPRGVLRAGRDREGRHRHAAHGRQHPAVHGHGGGGAEGVLRRGRPAWRLRRHRQLRRDLPLRPQHGRDPDGAVVPGAGPDRRPGPAPARVRRSARHRGGPARRRPPRRPARHEPGADERTDPGGARPTAGWTPATSASTPRGLDELREAVEPWTAEAAAAVCGVAAADIREAARIFGTSRRVALHGAAGLLPVLPGDGGVLPGQQPAPAARNAGPAGLRHPADERPAHGAEQPGVRRGRRPAGLPELGKPRSTSRNWPGCGTWIR